MGKKQYEKWVTFGYQKSLEDPELVAASTTGYYENEGYGITFNVNDDLSISYGYSDTKKGFVSNDAGNETVRGEATSFQIAYTMGGMSIKFAETDVDNAGYTTGTANDREATTIALSLAF